MSAQRVQTQATARFTCLGDKCPDTCCKGWGMQLTQETVDLYKARAPELLDAVDSGEAEFIMKRDAATDYCVKFDAGWCAIHRDYGPEFLGDACHFYPRITRALNDTVFTTAAISCPEMVRLMLLEEGGFALAPREELRVPFSLKNYLPEGLTPEQAMEVHQKFLDEAGSDARSAENNLMRVSAVAQALAVQSVAQWPQAAEFYFKIAEGRIPQAEAQAADMFNLLHALMGLVSASKATSRAPLMETIAVIADALGVTLDWETRGIHLAPDAMERGVKLLAHWRTHGAALQPMLRRYVQAQMSQAFFPFAGLGNTIPERTSIIGVRFATVKLALMAESVKAGGLPTEETIIRVVHSLSRFLDHLADPALSLSIYGETGWLREPRLRALIGDTF